MYSRIRSKAGAVTVLYILAAILIAGAGFGCVSAPAVRQQAYAKLSTSRTYEHDFATVWKAIEEALRGHKVVDRDPEQVSPVELRNLTERTLETDWVYGRSRDKFIEYKVNGLPRKQFLQTRFKYEVEAQKVMGGVKVDVGVVEQIERLNDDGSSDGYTSSPRPDTSRANELLDRIRMQILSRS